MGRSVVLPSHVFDECPCLASPGPSRIFLCSRVCVGLLVARRGFNCVYRASHSFYNNMALVVLFCAMVWGKRSSWCSSSLPVEKGCIPTVGASMWPSLKLRSWTVKMLQTRRKETAWRFWVIGCMHAVTWPGAVAVVLRNDWARNGP